MLEFAVLFSIKSYALAIAGSAVVGAVLGFLYGGKAQKAAEADIAKAASAVGSAASSAIKKL